LLYEKDLKPKPKHRPFIHIVTHEKRDHFFVERGAEEKRINEPNDVVGGSYQKNSSEYKRIA